jgi:serine/threonine protein kinase
MRVIRTLSPMLGVDFAGDDRFRIVRVLGAGGMGVVYEAHDTRENVRVALKTMRAAHPGALLRFKTEFRALADLAHPNLAALHELHLDGKVPFFTMELVRGVDFLTYVRGQDARTEAQPFASTDSAPPMSHVPRRVEPQAATIRAAAREHDLDHARLRAALRQLALGVQTLHDAGKLHRDLKPSNVLVTGEGRVVILDFGLVAEIDRVGSDATEQDQIAGTAEYMAPEQAACSQLGEPADWYAFGAMLYEALAEQLPYAGSRIKILSDKQTDDPSPPSIVREEVPEDLEQLAMELLRRDPSERPRGRRVLERLGVVRPTLPSTVVTTPPGTAVGPFVGRATHVAALHEAFERVLGGRPTTLHVRGPSGMGKSALVRRAIDEITSANGGGVVVLSGRCYEQESVPYKAVDSVIDSLSRYLRSLKKDRVGQVLPTNIQALERLFPVLRRVEAIATAPRRGAENRDPHEIRRRAFGALRELLTRIAERTPLVVWIDDLQWGDVDSGMLLGELLRPPDPPPLLFVVSYRSEADVDVGCLAALRRVAEGAGGAVTRTIDVDALSPEDARSLATTLLAGAQSPTSHAGGGGLTPVTSSAGGGISASIASIAPGVVESIATESAGNPFLLSELVRFHQSGVGLRRSRSGTIHLEDVLDARLAQCGEAARLMLEIVAAAGRPISLEVAIAATELEPAEARAAIAQLRAAQLVRTARVRDADGLDTYHDRVRETVPRILAEGALAKRHARLVAAIEASRDPDPEALATHCIAAGDATRAGEHALKAGEQAVATLAFDRAAEWFLRSIEWRHLEAGADREVRRKLADALADAGRGAEAGREYLRAAEGTSGDDGGELRQRAAAEFLTAGRMDEGIPVVRTLLASIGARYPTSQTLAIFLFLATVLIVRVRGYGFRLRPASALSAGELHRLDTFATVGKGLTMTDNLRGRYFLNRFLLGALRAGEPQRIANALVLESAHVSAFGASATERVYWLEKYLDHLPEVVATPQLVALRAFASGWARCFLGRWSEAITFLDDASERLRELGGGRLWERNTTNVWIVSSLWHLGRVRDLAVRIAAFREDAARRGDVYMCAFLQIGAGVSGARLAADEPERALADAESVFERWPQVADDVPRFFALTACVQSLLYVGSGEAAFARCAEAWPRLRRALLFRVQAIRITVLHVRGRAAVSTLARNAGTALAATARRAAEECLRALRRERDTYAPAMSLCIAASLAEHEGRVDDARRLLADAARGFDAFSMSLYAAACRIREGGLLGGAAGRALVDEAEARMRAESVKDPTRMAEMLVPAGRARAASAAG